MPSTPSGYSLPPVYRAVPGTTIRAEQHNVPLEDLAAGVNDSVARNGSRPMTGNLPMAGRKVTGLGAATQASDAVRFDQLPKISPFLTSVSSLSVGANQFVYASANNTAALANLTPFARSILDDSDASSVRSTLGLGAGATAPSQTQAIWNAGTSASESVISPAKLTAKINAQIGPRVRAWLHVWLHDGASNIVNIRGNSGVSSIVRIASGRYRVTTSFSLPQGYAVSANSVVWYSGGYQSGNDANLIINHFNTTSFEVWAMSGDTSSVDISGLMLTVTF